MATAFARVEAGKPFVGVATGQSPTRGGTKRLRKKMALFGSAALCALAGIYYAYRTAQPEVVFTDDAYVAATLGQVTPQIDGTIDRVLVHETEYVRRGQLLVSLDRQDAELDYQSALAAYEEAIRRAEGEIANSKAAHEDVRVKAALVEQAQLQLQRRAATPGVVSAEEISNARTALAAAKYALAIAQKQATATGAMVKELDSAAVPPVKVARINLARAILRLQRTELRAPIEGLVAQFHAQAGQQVALGLSLMSIVPIHQLYVEANFKESQIDRISVGQRAILTSDLYGSGNIFHGTVEGIGGGTGAAFSIIPAQNASGNWIKVVQRVPVRIVLDAEELNRAPLRVGLSMNATVELEKPVAELAPSPSTPSLRAIARAAY